MGQDYLTLGGYKLLSTLEHIAHAESAILKALEIDEELAEAHASLGSLRVRQWDWASAEKALKNAIKLNPNYATAYVGHATYLGIVVVLIKQWWKSRKLT